MDSPQDDALAMAQAMGFSSFGTQNRPQKRRKFTAPANPHSAPQPQLQVEPQSQPQSQPLLAPELPAATNADEIGLDDDDDDQEVPSLAQSSLAKPPPGANLPARPPAPHGAAHPHPHPHPHQHQQHQHQQHQHQHQHQPQPQPHQQQHVRSGFNPRWYEGYYDPSSNENPWLRLETFLGLEPRGPWLPRA